MQTTVKESISKKEEKYGKRVNKAIPSETKPHRPNPVDNYKAIQSLWDRMVELANNEKFVLDLLEQVGIVDKEIDEKDRVTYHPNDVKIAKLRSLLE